MKKKYLWSTLALVAATTAAGAFYYRGAAPAQAASADAAPGGRPDGPPKGKGGRNQEMALAFLAELARDELKGANIYFLSASTDGTDGPTDAAGGYVDGDTLAALEAGGWSGYAALQNNDSYHALKAVDGLIITGATGTNVNDVAVALIGEKTPPVSPEVSPEW